MLETPGETWKLTVYGRPVPQGDLSAVPVMRKDEDGQRVVVTGKGGFPVVNQTHANEKTLKPWRQEIAGAAIDAGWPALGLGALDCALAVRLVFYFKRPESQWGTGRNAELLKDSAELYPERTGADIDKLERAVLDALTGIVWKDDKRIVTLVARRRYSPQERVEISVRRLAVRTMGELRELRGLREDLAADLADQLQLELV